MLQRISYLLLPLFLLAANASAVRFGALSSFADADLVEYFTPSNGGGVDVLNESAYELYTPYEGMYLVARYDRRLDSLSSILPENGLIIICCTGTPQWNTGWWTSESLPEGEASNRFVHDYCYEDLFAFLVSRYGSDGARPLNPERAVTTWSIWGEPDGGQCMCGPAELEADFQSAQDAGMREYFLVSCPAVQRIRALDESATIVSGSFLSPQSLDPDLYEDYWNVQARRCLQMCLAGYYTSSNQEAEFGWPVGPDAFDWHPYDLMSQNDNDNEVYYDPLVIDDDDLMYRTRCDSLAEYYLDSWFEDGEFDEPLWDEMPQYLLEFCPIYTLAEWRRTYSIPPNEFHSYWRANFHITSCLMLAQSAHLEIITPWLAGSGQWWARANDGEATYQVIGMPETLWPSPADLAYRFMSAQLNDKVCLGYSQSSVQAPMRGFHSSRDAYNLAHWTFGSGAQNDPHIHAFRTFRATQEVGSWDKDLDVEVEFNVRPCVASLDQYSLTGEHLGTLNPDNNGDVTIEVDGFVTYAIESFSVACDEDATVESSPLSQPDSQESYSVRLYDLSGRLVLSESTGSASEGSLGLSIGRIAENANLPRGCYVATVIDSDGSVLLCRKVLVSR
jgi:hypothetical protein